MAKGICPKCDGKITYSGGTPVHSITGLKTCAASITAQVVAKTIGKAVKKALK